MSKDNDKEQSGFSIDDTVVALVSDETLQAKLAEITTALNSKLCIAEDGTDIIATPSFLAIIDPGELTHREKAMIHQYLLEANDPGWKILLTKDLKQKGFIPGKNLIKRPDELTDEFLKFLILKTRSTLKRRRRIWDRTERRIVRILFMLRILDSGNSFMIKDIAKEFDVTRRTIQRDINVLEVAGYPIFTNHKGKYWLPEDFKIWEFYYEPLEGEPND